MDQWCWDALDCLQDITVSIDGDKRRSYTPRTWYRDVTRYARRWSAANTPSITATTAPAAAAAAAAAAPAAAREAAEAAEELATVA